MAWVQTRVCVGAWPPPENSDLLWMEEHVQCMWSRVQAPKVCVGRGAEQEGSSPIRYWSRWDTFWQPPPLSTPNTHLLKAAYTDTIFILMCVCESESDPRPLQANDLEWLTPPGRWGSEGLPPEIGASGVGVCLSKLLITRSSRWVNNCRVELSQNSFRHNAISTSRKNWTRANNRERR